MNKEYLKGLTKMQRDIVEAPHGPIRVIAGPGSGKTRVLTHRIAHLVLSGLDPNRIIALTFTNIAAKEMKMRVQDMIGKTYKTPWISTYHSFCYQFLKYWGEIDHVTEELKFDRKFDIMDSNAQKALLKRIYVEIQINYSDIPYNAALSYIAIKKKSMMFNFKLNHDAGMLHQKIYDRYVEHQIHMNLLDFDDLISITRKVLEDNLEVRRKWQARITYLLVDEFQDTSFDQVKIIQYLVNPNFNNIFVVGDPFQTIYTWRGANSHYLTSHFLSSYPKTKTYPLVENFRSAKKIVSAANVIRDCITKTFYEEKHENLISILSEHGKIHLKKLMSKPEQGRYVVNKINDLYKKGEKLSEIAILFRRNRESAEYEKSLRLKAIPYRIYGAFAFLDRLEVQDAIAYLALINSSASDMQIERIIVAPRKGIGTNTIEKFYTISRKYQLSLEYILFNSEKYLKLSKNTLNKLSVLKKALDKAKYELKINPSKIDIIFRDFLKEIGYFGIFEGKLEEDERRENVEELLSDIIESFKDDTMTLQKYLDKLKLLEGKEDLADREFVSLMTFHKAKGKEYKHVFVVSLMDGFFPSYRKLDDADTSAIEEEWRLFYVAITRAKHSLYFSCYELNHSTMYGVSRFVQPLMHLIKNENSILSRFQNMKITNSSSSLIKLNTYFKIGKKVNHRTFGKGKIIDINGNMISVEFKNYGRMKLSMKGKLWI